MKAEDIERMYYRYVLFSDAPTVPWPSLSHHARMAFAAMCRACEQHGIERAKAAFGRGRSGATSWLDAEVAKENLERANPQPRIRCAGHYGEMYPRDDSCGWEGQPVELRNGCCPVCGAGHMREVGPVKVEILERASSAYGPTDDGDRAFLSEVARAEFARGMRRAVELVEQHLYYCQGWDEFDAAIKEELK